MSITTGQRQLERRKGKILDSVAHLCPSGEGCIDEEAGLLIFLESVFHCDLDAQKVEKYNIMIFTWYLQKLDNSGLENNDVCPYEAEANTAGCLGAYWLHDKFLEACSLFKSAVWLFASPSLYFYHVTCRKCFSQLAFIKTKH